MIAKQSVRYSYLCALCNLHNISVIGDPQTAVSHLGDVVLFAEATIARLNVSAANRHLESLGLT